MSNFVDFCSDAAPWATVGVYLAPFPTVEQIRRDKTVGSLPMLPYSSMAASSFIWTVYGFLKKEPKVWSCCLVGITLASYYLVHFIRHSPKRSPTLPGSVNQHLACVVVSIVAALYILKRYPAPTEIIGMGAVMLSIAMFASPLSALKHVIRTKSAKSIPLPFTIASIINCLLWTITGLFQMDDPNLYVPNILGLSFSLTQVFLKLIYGDGEKAHADALPM